MTNVNVDTDNQTVKISGVKEESKSPNKRTGRKSKRVSFQTWEGHSLTANEAKFIDEYITIGVAKTAYEHAYGITKNTAQKAQDLLNLPYVNSEINYRLQKAAEESIASATEIMNYLSSVMRGEVKDQFGLEAPLAERTRAAVELAKRQIDMPRKMEQMQSEPPQLKITLDWQAPKDMTTVEEMIRQSEEDAKALLTDEMKGLENGGTATEQ